MARLDGETLNQVFSDLADWNKALQVMSLADQEDDPPDEPETLPEP